MSSGILAIRRLVGGLRREALVLAGWLLLGMLGASIAHDLWPSVPEWLAGSGGWLAACLLWSRLPTMQQVQVGVLGGFGLLGVMIGVFHGAAVPVEQLLTRNQLIIVLIAAISFLRMVELAIGTPGGDIPTGRPAFRQTMFGLILFGAVINISALIIIGDRLAERTRLNRREITLLGRTFSLVVLFSPFIGGMALALNYAEGAQLSKIVLAGLPLLICGAVYVYYEAIRLDPQQLSDFQGYPIRYESLIGPVLLAVSVFIVHQALPEVSVLTVISLTAPLLTIGLLIARRGVADTVLAVLGHVRQWLPRMSSELTLFLSAGVLAVGLSTAVAGFGGWVPFAHFDAQAASIALGVTVTVAILGVHPVVTLTTIAALVAPLDPDPNLVALTFVMGWSIGCAVSPFSGTSVTLHARYGVKNWDITKWNIAYTSFMYAVACASLFLFDELL